MSQWTHIVGSFRVEAPYKLDEKDEANTPNPKVTLMTIPTGSEGPMRHKFNRIKCVGSRNGLGIFNIFGDLRNYNDAEEIFMWVKGLVHDLKEQHYHVRDLSVNVEVERDANYLIYSYEYDKIGMLKLTDALKVLFK